MSQADTPAQLNALDSDLASQPSEQPNEQPSEERQADFLRRLRAAGIDPESEGPADIDAFRYQLARMICMFLNEWRGCPQTICRRNRGCMAPDSFCANVEQPTPEQMERDWPEVQAEVYKGLKAHLARFGPEDA